MKKFFKWFFGSIAAIIVLALLSYGGFHLWEYATGGKYVAYLSAHSETVAVDDSFSFELMADDLAENKVILVGEIHGFKVPCDFDVDFFKHLHANFGVRHYFAEMDFVQASLLNGYMASGDEAVLSEVLRRWAVFQGRNNQDYFNKYVQFHQYYQSLPDDQKFTFIGVDQLQDVALSSAFVVKLLPEMDDMAPTQALDSIMMQIDVATALYATAPDTLFMLNHIKKGVQSAMDKENREEVMFGNFHKLYKHYQLQDSKVYGFFGLLHVFQYMVDGADPLAAQIRKSDLGLEGKILSMNFFLNESNMVMPSSQLPEFMRDEGKYSRMPISADNMLFVYIYGVKDFKRMTPEHHKSLIKMNAPDSPYDDSNRLNTTIQLLPVTDVFEMNEEGKPYVQYTVFVRNSDWAAPMEE